MIHDDIDVVPEENNSKQGLDVQAWRQRCSLHSGGAIGKYVIPYTESLELQI